MTTKTETVQTEYGDVGFEVVECQSCGIDTKKENALDVVAGNVTGTRTWNYKNTTEVEFSNPYRRGYCCEHCVETGYIKLDLRKEIDNHQLHTAVTIIAITLCVLLLLAVIV